MMKIITKIASLVLFVLTMSCTKEGLNGSGSVPVGDEVELRFNAFGAVATVNPEDAVNRVRILIFGSTASQDRGQMLCNQFAVPDKTGKIAPVIVTSGVRNIYLIINEPRNTDGSELKSYKNITKISDIEALELAYAGTSANPPYRPTDIPMFIKHTDQVIMPDSENEISGEVERMMAKVTLNLNIKNSNFTQDKQPVIQNITIKNLPNKSYYVAKPYTGTFVNSEIQQPEPITVAGYDYSCTNTFYVPEYILSKVDDNAYIEITGSIGNASGKAIKWIVKLGDAMVTGQSSFSDRYDIRRNSHYTMTGDVKSYGEREELDVEVTVLPWDYVNGGLELGDMLDFSKITTTVDDKLVPIADGGYVHIQGETITVHCKTNVGGWYALTYKGATLVHTSATTDEISSTEVQPVTVVIPTSSTLLPPTTDIGVEYTIKLYHPTIAPESAGPFKTLTIKQDAGVIPNSVLVKPVIFNGESFDGWPVDKLPLLGLQLAKRGNKLPSETALSVDQGVAWELQLMYSNTGTDNTGCGFGKSDTDKVLKLLKQEPLRYPAVGICRDLGEEWYLPSKDELVLICFNLDLLGSSYTYEYQYTSAYWSVSQYERQIYTCWYVDFDSKYVSRYERNDFFSVRCVRDL